LRETRSCCAEKMRPWASCEPRAVFAGVEGSAVLSLTGWADMASSQSASSRFWLAARRPAGLGVESFFFRERGGYWEFSASCQKKSFLQSVEELRIFQIWHLTRLLEPFLGLGRRNYRIMDYIRHLRIIGIICGRGL
jgi:hypothetical protein